MIKNIIFDIGGVLVDFRPEGVLRDMDIPEKTADTILAQTMYNGMWSELDRGARPEEEVLSQMRASLPDEETRLAFDRFIKEGKPHLAVPYSYAAEWLKSYRDRGYHVYILSNYPVSYFEAHRPTFPFLSYAEGGVVSGYVKVIKPQPEIYRCLLDKYQLKAEECIFIDDVERNAKGADAVGIHGVQFLSLEDAKEKVEQIIKAEEQR